MWALETLCWRSSLGLNSIELLKHKQEDKHRQQYAHQNKLIFQNTMSHIPYVTGILHIFAKHFCLSSSMKLDSDVIITINLVAAFWESLFLCVIQFSAKCWRPSIYTLIGIYTLALACLAAFTCWAALTT